MGRTNIRLATDKDESEVIAFIDAYWKKNHIFVREPEVFSWQYRNNDGRWNIVIAESQDGNEEKSIVGILGFIPMGHYDKNLGDDCIFLAVWKVRDDICPPGVGLQMLKHIKKTFSPSFIGAIGISDMVKPIYRALGYTTGRLDQLAFFNPSFSENYKIATVPDNILCSTETLSDAVNFSRIDEEDIDLIKKVDDIALESSPKKSFNYIKNRYLKHPWYNYKVKVVIFNNSRTAIIVWREVELGNRKALRVVDIIGEREWLEHSGSAFLEETKAAEAEYIEIMASGINLDALKSAGFISAEDYEGLIIPNYFSPYVNENIEISYAYKLFQSSGSCSAFFRADSDQDRPN